MTLGFSKTEMLRHSYARRVPMKARHTSKNTMVQRSFGSDKNSRIRSILNNKALYRLRFHFMTLSVWRYRYNSLSMIWRHWSRDRSTKHIGDFILSGNQTRISLRFLSSNLWIIHDAIFSTHRLISPATVWHGHVNFQNIFWLCHYNRHTTLRRR